MAMGLALGVLVVRSGPSYTMATTLAREVWSSTRLATGIACFFHRMKHFSIGAEFACLVGCPSGAGLG